MRTGAMIGLIVASAAAMVLAAWVALMALIGRLAGTIVMLGVGAIVALAYRLAVRPWHLRWGATDEEVERAMPGDDLLPGAESATRAITIAATPEEVWPWLVQLGFGRAGWYSYDWIDNDFEPSADHILPEFQHLEIGDRILMMPSMGFEVRSIDEPHSIVSMLEDGSTSWCLGLYPETDGTTRLVSRWRPAFERSVATFFMVLLVEPGTFIMEQKMLRTIRDRVESSAWGHRQVAAEAHRVTVEVTINRPPQEVFDFIADPTNDVRWCPTVSGVETTATDDGGLTSYRFVQHVGPLRHTESCRIVESERPRRLRWHFTAMGSSVDATIELEAVEGGTRLVQTNEVSGVGRLRWLIQERIAARELPRQQARLKVVLEDEEGRPSHR